MAGLATFRRQTICDAFGDIPPEIPRPTYREWCQVWRRSGYQVQSHRRILAAKSQPVCQNAFGGSFRSGRDNDRQVLRCNGSSSLSLPEFANIRIVNHTPTGRLAGIAGGTELRSERERPSYYLPR